MSLYLKQLSHNICYIHVSDVISYNPLSDLIGVLYVLDGMSMVRSRILLLSFLSIFHAADAENSFIVNGGSCYTSDCSCRAECCDGLDDLFQKAYLPSGNNGTTGEVDQICIGYGPNFRRSTSTICDHATNATAIFLQPFIYNGTLTHCEWYINFDCTDQGVIQRGGGIKKNKDFWIGLAEKKDPTNSTDYTFRLLGHIKLNRVDWWDDYLTSGTNKTITNGGGATFVYSITAADLANLTQTTNNLENLHIAMSWSNGGVAGYNQYDVAWDQNNDMAIFETEFLRWDEYTSFPTNYVEMTGGVRIRRRGRHYNMQCCYQPNM